MKFRYWFLVFYAVLAAGLTLVTGWLGWLWCALPIAFVAAVVLLLSGHSHFPTVGRRRRELNQLADEIGARDGTVVYEHFDQWDTIGYRPHLNVQSVRPGTPEAVQREVLTAAAKVGYTLRSNGFLQSRTGQYTISAHATTAADTYVFAELVPPDHVKLEVSIRLAFSNELPRPE